MISICSVPPDVKSICGSVIHAADGETVAIAPTLLPTLVPLHAAERRMVFIAVMTAAASFLVVNFVDGVARRCNQLDSRRRCHATAPFTCKIQANRKIHFPGGRAVMPIGLCCLRFLPLSSAHLQCIPDTIYYTSLDPKF